ncbi:hypothetical protein RIVERRIDER_16 [Xanthomonas phage RiverRider]|uniref:Uncharacterized protein n=1 Tax=Xanthomonas phage RiverRider TaxID=2108116 RepID=A0A2P1JUU8_9CAUD|nr:hypothetical protein HWB58_gp16 [Xanthomonas phage RiverRider]AVO23104.1 hypothetical protein RIVERRIDER_16 [Xanthomonas phage RiverRider]
MSCSMTHGVICWATSTTIGVPSMPKKIIRFVQARLDQLPNLKPGAIVSFTPNIIRGYIPEIINASFDNSGYLTRFETEERIYVQVKND